jgi:hypothetical protein
MVKLHSDLPAFPFAVVQVTHRTPPTRRLPACKGLKVTVLVPEGALYLFHGYGTPGQEVAGGVATQRPGQPS